MKVVFVHGACVTDGAWWWHRMDAPLAELGLSSHVVELPSCGSGHHPFLSQPDLLAQLIASASAFVKSRHEVHTVISAPLATGTTARPATSSQLWGQDLTGSQCRRGVRDDVE
ncbi:MAG: hypothetical protein ACT4NY_28150 [Pseudonocardiales bacterium]